MQHIETEKHKNYINNKINNKINSNQTINKNYGYRGYFKCECGSLIKLKCDIMKQKNIIII